jgi:hypothetical protein
VPGRGRSVCDPGTERPCDPRRPSVTSGGPDAVVVINASGCIVYVNPAVRTLLGHEPGDLRGLLNHLALVGDSWFRVRFSGLPDDALWAGIDWDADPDYEFRTAADVEPQELRRRYEAACASSREVVAGAHSLDQLSVEKRQNGMHFDLRWVLLHLIEETARHAGHADLLREAVDGTTGE